MERATHYITNRRGSALTEMVISLPLLILIMQGIFYFGQGSVIKQKAVVAARYAAWERARDPSRDPATLQRKVSRFFFHNKPVTLDTTPPGGKKGLPERARLPHLARILDKVDRSHYARVSHRYTPPSLSILPSVELSGEHFVERRPWRRKETGGLGNLLHNSLRGAGRLFK